MRKNLIFSVLLSLFALFAASKASAAPELKMLADGVYAFIGGDGKTNSGFVVTGKGVVVIDTQGPPELAKLLKDKIRETTDKPVSHVVNTHYHGDHTFGNQYFGEGIIMAHEDTRSALIDKDQEHRAMFKKFFGEDSLREFTLTLPDVTFTDRMILRYGGRTMELVYAGARAHTGGDVFVWLPEEKVLFAGDLLYNKRLPLLKDGDSAGALKAVDMITGTGAKTLVPGHGPISTGDDATAYKGFLEALRDRVRKMKDAGMSRADVTAKISLPAYSSWAMYKEWLPLNAGKVYDELSMEKEKKD